MTSDTNFILYSGGKVVLNTMEAFSKHENDVKNVIFGYFFFIENRLFEIFQTVNVNFDTNFILNPGE